jgi:cation diffusion facilitator CzcD-associated flavoprotein CzcO
MTTGSAKPRTSDCDVAIIGAGPYGLSAAAHLSGRGVDVQVFGEPMEFWAEKMPAGMLLRSPRVASNLSDPRKAYTLEAFESSTGMKPEAPLPLETFVAYGRWFREHLGTKVQKNMVTRVARENGHFKVELSNGDHLRSKRVVVAAGVGSFSRKPAVFERLPGEMASHCYEGRKVSELANKRIAVIGAGQSALESAAILHEAGADVEVIAKLSELRWLGEHAWLHNLGPISAAAYTYHDIGPFGISRLVAMPNVVSYIPLPLRDKLRKRAVRPIGSKWLRPRVANVKASLGRFVQQAEMAGEEIKLVLDDRSERRVDHVLMGTGYDVDISKYSFLQKELVSQVETFGGYPKLVRGFQSSVQGLHFIGAPAGRSFGPLMFFVTGTDFTCSRLAWHISRRTV